MLKKYWSILINALRINFKILKEYPRVFVPFAIRALVSFGFLILVLLSPSSPFVKILGVPIAGIYGNSALHYPYNFVYMPQIFSDIKFFIVNPLFSTLAAAVCSGIVCDYFIRREPSFWPNFNKAVRRFFILFPCMFLLLALSYAVNKLAPIFLMKGISGNIMILAVVFFLVVLIEVPFSFCFISVMVDRKSVIAALKDSFKFAFKIFPVVFIAVLVIRLLDFGANLLLLAQPYLTARYMPDVTVLIIIVSIILAILSDSLVYSLCSSLYCLGKNVK